MVSSNLLLLGQLTVHDAEPADVGLVIILHRDAARQAPRSVGPLQRSGASRGEGASAIHAWHHHRREQPLSLAEQQNGLGHLSGLENFRISNVIYYAINLLDKLHLQVFYEFR